MQHNNEIVAVEEAPEGTENEIPVEPFNDDAQMHDALLYLKIDELWETSLPVQPLVEELCQFPFENAPDKAELVQLHAFFRTIWQKIDAKMKDCQINDQQFSRDAMLSSKSFYSDNQEGQDMKTVKDLLVTPPGYPKLNNDMMADLSNFIAKNEKSGDKTFDFINCLKPGELVDDDVVLKEMTLIRERSIRCKGLPSVYFLTPGVFSWLYKQGVEDALNLGYDAYDMFTSDFVIIPLHFDVGSAHWALAVADFREPENIIITYYDSILDRLDTGQKARSNESLTLLQKYLKRARERAPSSIIGKPNTAKNNFILKVCDNAPQQDNDFDCGIFILKIADYVSFGHDLDFQQKHIPYFRKVIAWEIMTNRLLWIPQQAKADD